MTTNIGAWEIKVDGPEKLSNCQIDFEKDLEDWIVKDPGLVQKDLVIIGRQVHLDSSRAILDLLALDIQGRWVVIEIKKGMLSRETIAQVLDYTACLAKMTETEILTNIKPETINPDLCLREMLKERDALESLDPKNRSLSMIIVGAGRSPELDQMADYLAGSYGVPLTVVTFQVIESSEGKRFMVRELSEPEQLVLKEMSTPTLDELQEKAEQNGIGQGFQSIKNAALKAGLYPRLWKTSVMYASPANKTRSLFTVWDHPWTDKIKLYLVSEALAEHFQVAHDKVQSLMGPEGWQYLSEEQAEAFTHGLNELAEQNQVER